MKNVTVVQNGFVQDALRYLRKKDTDMKTFRYHSDKLCYLLLSNCMQDDDVRFIQIQTPIAKTNAVKIKSEFVFVSILRSGIAMLNSALQLLPNAPVGFAGIYRDEATALPNEYYWKMPSITSKSTILITDPMLATGGSALHVIRKLYENKPKEIRIISIVAAPEGISAIHREYPKIKIFLASLDSHLNEQNYIVPGIGDFGDRYFGTEVQYEIKK